MRTKLVQTERSAKKNTIFIPRREAQTALPPPLSGPNGTEWQKFDRRLTAGGRRDWDFGKRHTRKMPGHARRMGRTGPQKARAQERRRHAGGPKAGISRVPSLAMHQEKHFAQRLAGYAEATPSPHASGKEPCAQPCRLRRGYPRPHASGKALCATPCRLRRGYPLPPRIRKSTLHNALPVTRRLPPLPTHQEKNLAHSLAGYTEQGQQGAAQATQANVAHPLGPFVPKRSEAVQVVRQVGRRGFHRVTRQCTAAYPLYKGGVING